MEGDNSITTENSASNHHHVNGMSNGYSSDKHHSSKSERKDKHRDKHRDHHKDKSKDRDKSKEHKSSSRDKDKEKEKDRHHSSSSSSKDKEKSSSNKSSSRDKERDKDKDRHKSSSSSSKDKDKEHRSSKDHKSSSSSSRSKDRKDKENEKSKEHRDRDKEKDKDKEKEKDRHRHSSSSGKDKHKDKHRDKDKEREKDRHKDRKEKDRKSDKYGQGDSPVKVKAEVKEEHAVSSPQNGDADYFEDDQKLVIKDEYDNESEPDIVANNSQASSCDYNLSQFKDEPKFEGIDDDDEDSEEDIPLAKRLETSKRKLESDDEDEEKPVKLKKVKKEKIKKRVISDDEEEYDDIKPKKKKGKKNATVVVKKEEVGSPKKRKKKEEEQPEVWKWWEEEKRDDGTKWKFLEHKGPVFAPAYDRIPRDVKFLYDGKEMMLSEEAEEVAGFYARMLDHDYTTKDVFNNNFFKDWRKCMTDEERKKITDLRKCNFSKMHAYFMDLAEKNRNRTKEEKLALKEKNEAILKEYGFCTIDGHKEKIGNFKIEPPGLFRGRGEHPKMGMLKKRVMPEDVLINCSKNSAIPKPPPGHKWKEVRHDPAVTWLASWTENVQNQVKYVMLNPSSKLKGEKDWQKYETARRLHKCIDKIRSEYRDDWKSKEMRIRQRAVALYFIDKLALRAGNEKDEDQADTVGCCSLRVEHIELHEHKDDKDYVVVFDFLGKDSIRYYNEVPVEKRVFKNLQLFMDNKSPGDDLFDRLNTAVMNKHLNELMEGLTAKVFRTYNASFTLQQQLEKLTNADDSISEKILSYNRANRAVAILCNHQRAVPKGHAKSMEKLKEKIADKKQAIKETERGVKDAHKDAKRGSVKEKQIYDKKKKQLEKMREQLAKLEIEETNRDENKTIALGTSKLNYLDPRISVAWCKKYDVPIEKIYNKTQRDKFRWAIDMAGPDYVF